MTNLLFLLCWWVGIFTQPATSPYAFATSDLYIHIDPAPPPVAIIEPANKFRLCDDKGKDIAIIDLKTGKVTMRGNPNKAARQFWRAVEMMHGMMKESINEQ